MSDEVIPATDEAEAGMSSDDSSVDLRGSEVELLPAMDGETPPLAGQPEPWAKPNAWKVRSVTVPLPPRTANDTPFPPTLMDWPLPPRETTVDPVRTVATLEFCPTCRTTLRALAEKRYCLKCGYSSDKAAENERKGPSALAVAFALTVAIAGAIVIVLASIYRRDFLDAGTTARVWWIVIEALFGFVLYWVGHYLAVFLTYRHMTDDDLDQHLDPLCVWRYAFLHLPRTQLALYAGFWGVTAMVTAFVLFCVNDFSAEDRTTRPPKYGSIVGRPGRDEPDYTTEQGPRPAVRPRGPSRPIDDSEPPPSDAPKLQLADRTTDCVVIGYIPGSDDPDRVAQLALGTRSLDGTITFAGTAGQFADGANRGLTPTRFRRLANRPDYLPAGGSIIPVEPVLTARVSYSDRDGQGRLLNVTVTRLSGPGN